MARSARVLDAYASGGSFDELIDPEGTVRPAWSTVRHRLSALTARDVDRWQSEVRRAVRRAGRAEAGALDRAWRLDPLPLLIDHETWSEVRAGVAQRAELLRAAYVDLYGEQRLLSGGVLPAQAVTGHGGFVRSLAGGLPHDPRPLSVVACDLQRGADGRWRVVADQAQNPVGLGYALQNRQIMAAAVPSWSRDAPLHRLGPYVQVIRDALAGAAEAATETPVIVVLSPSPEERVTDDHAVLATALGFPLVEAEDLVVDAGAVWLRGLAGRSRVDVILRGVDAEGLDPLEGPPVSQIGVPGLLEMVRRSRVRVVNGPGAGVVDDLAVWLPDACESLLSEPLLLPAWVASDGPPSTAPVLDRRALVPAGVRWRVFAVAQGSGFRPMAGGLALVGDADEDGVVRTFRGSKDVWVIKQTPDDPDHGIVDGLARSQPRIGTAAVPRALADLYAVGRSIGAVETAARSALVLGRLAEDFADRPLTAGGRALEIFGAAVHGDSPAAQPDPRAWARTILSDPEGRGRVAPMFADLTRRARRVQDQWSADFWVVVDEIEAGIVDLRDDPETGLPPTAAARLLTGLLALDGVVANMQRDAGWQMITIGQSAARASAVARLLAAVVGARHGLDVDRQLGQALLESMESSITHGRRHRGQVRAGDLVALLVTDEHNPRSLRFALDRVATHVAELPGAHGATRPERIIEGLREELHASDVRSLVLVDGPRRTALMALCARIVDDLRTFDDALVDTFCEPHARIRVFGSPVGSLA